MGSIKFGAEQAVKNCVRFQPGEKVVIITDKGAGHIAEEIAYWTEQVSPGNTRKFVMEEYGDRPDDGENPLKFPDEIGQAMLEADVSFYCAGGKKGELQSFRMPMISYVDKNERLRHAHMPGINDELMETGMSVDYSKVQEMCAKVAGIVRKAGMITVTTPAGTDFTVNLNPNYKWKISDGLIRSEDWSNLPDGEIFTCADSIPKGVIVVDGILGDYFSEKYGLLEATPVTLEVEDSRIRDVKCANEELVKELNEYMRQDDNANRIGEFAIGTNIGLDHLVGNLLQDEKFPGIHVAIGHGYPDKTGSDWDSKAHMDGVLKKTTIVVEGQTIMKDGVFTI
jgi:leucyl aminopeptidase (aminopeptidase T)